MTIEELRQAKDRTPFRPFVVRTDDGSEIRVSRPEHIAWNEETQTVAGLSGRAWDIIDVDQIASLEDAPEIPEDGELSDPVDDRRLLIEIRDCLRRIDDKLERLLETRRHPR